MQVLYERCAGIDVHKKTVVVTVLPTQRDGTTTKATKATRTLCTMTADLLALATWLDHEQVEPVAVESTGVYTPPTMLPKRWQNGSMGSRSCIATFVRV
jgi:transposase